MAEKLSIEYPLYWYDKMEKQKQPRILSQPFLGLESILISGDNFLFFFGGDRLEAGGQTHRHSGRVERGLIILV